MGIVDYDRIAATAEKRLFNSENISVENKAALRKFLDIYDETAATRGLFLHHIKLLIEGTDDISKEMHDRDKINRLFRKIKNHKVKAPDGRLKTMSLCYFENIKKVSLRFVRWLNDGEKPTGFKDIKGVQKKNQKRNLSHQDMVTWEDFEQLKKATNSSQIKAVLATQLDGGFRPSEFIEINYGDVTVKDDFIVIEIKKGKTGRRNVILWKAVPHLLRWLQVHPTKKRNDPLWVKETQNNGKISRYKYPALRKRINTLFGKKELDKPSDFYNLRHSACVLSKKDNVPEELAAAKFGHSVEYYVNTYGRLSTEDVLERYSKHYGIKREKYVLEKNIKCDRCQFVNEPKASVCEQCGSPLSLGKALEIKNETEKKLNEMMERLARVENQKIVIKKADEDNIALSNKEAIKNMIIKELFEKKIIDPKGLIKK
jgi:integrase